VGGIPTFWIPGSERLSVALLFGVGVRDETLVVRGVNHLVEHLALFGLDHRTLDFNGHVTSTCTAFMVTGSVSEVQGFLDHLAASLRSLPLERLEHERRVLRTEAVSRGRSLHGLHLDFRFGPNGTGLLDAEELGLRWLGPEQLRSWMSTWFTAGNAALAVSGPDPRQLRLDLPDGPKPSRAATPSELITSPTWAGVPGNVVALSTTAERTRAWTVASVVLTAVAEHRLRQVDGRTYAVVDSVLSLDAERGAFYLGADCLDEEADAVRTALSSELARLRGQGPSADELRSAIAVIRRAYSDDRGPCRLPTKLPTTTSWAAPRSPWPKRSPRSSRSPPARSPTPSIRRWRACCGPFRSPVRRTTDASRTYLVGRNRPSREPSTSSAPTPTPLASTTA